MRRCQKAGIMVRMVTGDNVETAKVCPWVCGSSVSPSIPPREGGAGGTRAWHTRVCRYCVREGGRTAVGHLSWPCFEDWTLCVVRPMMHEQTPFREGRWRTDRSGPSIKQAIARQCGILTAQGLVLEGPAFRAMTPRQLDEALPRLQARGAVGMDWSGWEEKRALLAPA